ncbi:hypothetical protein C0J52_26208 [Blattella germanica]|nr:hypothetical protein C0J52_26208 [Blattella germanica]
MKCLSTWGEDLACRPAMCYDDLESVENENLIDNILFSDVCGKMEGHNSRMWAYEEEHKVSEWERDTPKVNVWFYMTNAKLYGPFLFAESSITSNIYLNMLELILEPQPQEDGILDAVVFQHYGAPPDFAHIVRDYLNRTFSGIWIGRVSIRL